MGINNFEQLRVKLKPQTRRLHATGATARTTWTVRVEAADCPPSPGLWAPVSSSAQNCNPHNFVNIKYLFTKFLPQHHISIPNTFTKPKT
jgi:hypothetical protein